MFHFTLQLNVFCLNIVYLAAFEPWTLCRVDLLQAITSLSVLAVKSVTALSTKPMRPSPFVRDHYKPNDQQALGTARVSKSVPVSAVLCVISS